LSSRRAAFPAGRAPLEPRRIGRIVFANAGPDQAAAFRDPAISNTTPVAQSTAPTAGDSFSLWRVVMPTEASPILTSWEWLVGTGTTNDRIPSTSTTIPIQAKGRIDPPSILMG